MAAFPFRQLLVPTDFSACADAALALADRMAMASGGASRLIVLHASELSGGISATTMVQPDPHRPAVPMAELVRTSATARIRQQLEQLQIRSPVELRVALAPPLEAILDAARGADAIVMGTHGRAGLDHLLLGSVAERVVRVAPVPVITVRGGCPADAPEDRTEAEQVMLDEASG